MVAVRVREVRREAEIGFDRRGVLELQTASLEDLDVLSTIVRLEDEVVAAATRFRRRAGINLVPPLEEDQLDVRPFGGDGEPAGVAGISIVGTLFKPEHLRVEFQGFLLVAHDDGHVGQFLDHGVTQPRI